MNAPLLLTGIGLRTPHQMELMNTKPGVAWLEVHSENYLDDNDNQLNLLEEIKEDYPVSLHGVSLSIGSADELNWQYLRKLKNLINRIDPCLVSDHLCWSSIDGRYLHDLLPLPYTEETLNHVVTRIQQVQDYLQRQILIENISSYVSFGESTLTEWDFLRETAVQSGCGILLDVNNVYVSANNKNFDPLTYLAAIPSHLVQEIHLAGFSSTTINGKEILIDSHDHHVMPAVWDFISPNYPINRAQSYHH